MRQFATLLLAVMLAACGRVVIDQDISAYTHRGTFTPTDTGSTSPSSVGGSGGSTSSPGGSAGSAGTPQGGSVPAVCDLPFGVTPWQQDLWKPSRNVAGGATPLFLAAIVTNPCETAQDIREITAGNASLAVGKAVDYSLLQFICQDPENPPFASLALDETGKATYKAADGDCTVPAMGSTSLFVRATLAQAQSHADAPGESAPHSGDQLQLELSRVAGENGLEAQFSEVISNDLYTLRKSVPKVSRVPLGKTGLANMQPIAAYAWTIAVEQDVTEPFGFAQFAFDTEVANKELLLCDFSVDTPPGIAADIFVAYYSEDGPDDYLLADPGSGTCLVDGTLIVRVRPEGSYQEILLQPGKTMAFTLHLIPQEVAPGATLALRPSNQKQQGTRTISCHPLSVVELESTAMRPALTWSDLSEEPHSGPEAACNAVGTSADWIGDWALPGLEEEQFIGE